VERWERLGPVGFAFEPGLHTDLNLYPNKDALMFPEPVPGSGGEPAFALLHRPMWDLSWANPAEGDLPPPGLPDPRPPLRARGRPLLRHGRRPHRRLPLTMAPLPDPPGDHPGGPPAPPRR
jgi:hypothetical protein